MPSPSALHRITSQPTRKVVMSALAGASLVGAAAGCAPSSASSGIEGGAASGSVPTTAPSASAASGSAASHAYRDGTYSADGHYTSPNGPETVGVTLTLKSGIVTDVQITEHPTSANTRLFQKHFAAGIKDVVVGKKLDDLNVGVVAGSSLTGQGFNDAVSVIKGEAS